MENREIKFRAWSEGKMYTQSDKDEFTIYNIEKLLGKIKGDAILMQYVGLKDKNGVPIYEGDIVDYGSDEKPLVVTYYNKLGALFLGNCMFFEYNTEYFEVIGNVYQNPELLK